MAVLSTQPDPEWKDAAKYTLNFYVDKYGRTIVRKWRRKCGKYRKTKK